DLTVLADDAAGPGPGRGVVDGLGLTVEVRRGDEVDAAVVVGVAEPADHAVDVADALGAAVLPDQRTTVGTGGHRRLQTDGLLGLQLRVDRGVGLAVRPLRGQAGEAGRAVRVRGRRVAEGEHRLAARLVPGEALRADVLRQRADVLDLPDVEVVEVVLDVLGGL